MPRRVIARRVAARRSEDFIDATLFFSAHPRGCVRRDPECIFRDEHCGQCAVLTFGFNARGTAQRGS